ncbi:MAG: hypothetical protein IPG74_01475 [Flavobacteriales bacterium]|nr:hypothetical protein [Flavobacteriales bacterium]
MTNPPRSVKNLNSAVTPLRAVALLCAALLFLALVRLPIGYYTFLRIAVTIGALLLLYHHWTRSGINAWVVLFGAVAILFNPLLPIYLGDRSLWLPFNLTGGVLFMVAAFRMPAPHTRADEQ